MMRLALVDRLGSAGRVNWPLPTPFRETLVLRDVQGLDYREIAEVTGVPFGTVMSRLARGRGRLIADIRRSES
ncbi:MAG: hypothetical protein QOJ15_1067 [Bradyrhizobium sp.]|jgi:DNA-directed RNA polymerase specialized sigma24 family protein|nr:hypothetical protein [Bradyrhizobium sp.]